MGSKIEKFVGDDSCTPRDFDTYRYINNLQDKVNEIIDHLNSQAQPEENEEWEKRFIRTFGYWGEEIKFIKQLLKEREKEASEEVVRDLIKKIEDAHCDSISLELLKDII